MDICLKADHIAGLNLVEVTNISVHKAIGSIVFLDKK